jgi:hypothetical protein
LHLFKKFYEKEERSKGNTKPIIKWGNCAHFGGRNSDPNIARAELFGQKKGASAHAYKDINGLVDTANGGALILEEIGELPMEVQAMLLTFIETGEYREVGGAETKFADVRIVGATNREKALREDFRYRFFPYYLPALYTRREDILYYLSYKYPELVQSLTKNEVLILLAYNWPGNVREIDRIARRMHRDRISGESIIFENPEMKLLYQLGRFGRLDDRESEIKGDFTEGLLEAISDWGGDSEFLESILNRFGIGLSDENAEPAFKKIQLDFDQFYDEQKGLADLENEYDVKILLPIEKFEDAYKGYLAYCGLFMQDPDKNINAVENLDNANFKHFRLEGLEYPEGNEAQIIKLAKAIMQYLKLVEVDEDTMPDDLQDFWKELVEIAGENGDVDNQQYSSNLPGTKDIFDMSENELKKIYYSGLLLKSGGKVKSASQIAGLKETTFRSRLDKLGITYKKKALKNHR